MSSLAKDRKNNFIQGFAPREIVQITSGSAWNPGNAVAFRVSDTCTYKINGAGLDGNLRDGDICVVGGGVDSYTFNSTMNIEVM